ncbi:mRNA N6-adenosine methyltransferase [Komagataella phaffii CBS 7435]|uniref:mRNA m(6)A methyltransferase n=1 Tax=Komagataella phaffii (strain ATCC 76273 / CBS 7435 / CECT 11047 / NRRL Y-11430 / Wegner 21-1) TaxID=981350 RepID=F2QT89_KOMPC|nr:GQ67_00403T0 [Komagataella phaffii]AOA67685.1 GQ68_00986T0 [Komagataella phaffii GS115]CAH2448498.1 mRNA N6-adenosine methyltransferase [Komagataella phaffii CBS 7435]CCA38617.1 mRNA N6-adenosine methyltransferase [Komagataella phaffii CBS 7435]
METILPLLLGYGNSLLRFPVEGNVSSLFRLQSTLRWHEFLAGLIRVNKLSNSLEFDTDIYKFYAEALTDVEDQSKSYNCSVRIKNINCLALEILEENLPGLNVSTDLKENKKKPRKKSNLQQLNELLEYRPADSELNELMSLLCKPSGALRLSNEKMKEETKEEPTFEICNQSKHAEILAGIDIDRCAESLKRSRKTQLLKCLETKIHFVPIIKSHTDPKLGDCSYLDTCHKLKTCKYLHYYQTVPTLAANKPPPPNSPTLEVLASYTKGEPISKTLCKQLPAQWINCDVRKLNFNRLGKFAAIIADPPWNIHTNSIESNETELLKIPVDQIQDEGIFLLWVTVRSTSIGRAWLLENGYTVSSELIWVKTNQLGRNICTGRTGHWLNHSKEHLLVGIKGRCTWLQRGLFDDIILASTRETGRKPDELYVMVEKMVGEHARKLEIFGKQHNVRPGWLTIGNQLEGNNVVEDLI